MTSNFIKVVPIPMEDTFSIQLVNLKTKGIMQSRIAEKSKVGEYVQHAIDYGTLAGLKNFKRKT